MNTIKSSSESSYVRLKPNVRKIVASISYIIALGGKRKKKKSVPQYVILKSLFLADKAHLNEYGRPVTFDNYVAMRAGPVPSLAYDLLKEKESILRKYYTQPLPWSREFFGDQFYYSNANVADLDDVLSDSDKKALKVAYEYVANSSFSDISTRLHSDPAYIDAWSGKEAQKHKSSFPMNMGLFFEEPDFEQVGIVQFLSKHM